MAIGLMDLLGGRTSVAREGERGFRNIDPFSTVREGETDPFSTAREGERRMAMSGGIKPTMTDLGWPADMTEEDKAVVFWLMMNHDKIKGGPNPFTSGETGLAPFLQFKHFGTY